jgi:hypothetical protein
LAPLANRLSIYKYICLLWSYLNFEFPILCETGGCAKGCGQNQGEEESESSHLHLSLLIVVGG